MQAGLTPILAKALTAMGLLDPVSVQTGRRVSEDILMIIADLATIPSARASTLPVLHTAQSEACNNHFARNFQSLS